MVLGPPSRSIKDRGWMALTDLDQRRGSHLARLPLVARCQPLEFGEDGIGFDKTSRKELFDVVNLSDHSNVYLANPTYIQMKIHILGYAPHFPTMTPITRPPMAPRMRIGAYAFVIIASGRLSKIPKTRPCAHGGNGRCAAPMTKPIAKRFRNAPVSAAVLSGEGQRDH